MTFIKKTENGYSIENEIWDEKNLIEGFLVLIDKGGFDKFPVSCGVNASPDFGYFELADRFWRASLSIYFFGTSNGFWERGAGYPEPWLFNARHSFELYLKGFLLYSFWFEELQNNTLSSGRKRQIDDLKSKTGIGILHDLYKLYEDYENKLKELIKKWNTEKLSDAPEIDKMILKLEGKEILKEIDEADKKSFRFRYPNLKVEKIDHLQELTWKHDTSQLLPKTGLPKSAGYFFDHTKVINSFHDLRQEMKSIESYLDGCWAFIGEGQDIIKSEWMGEIYSL